MGLIVWGDAYNVDVEEIDKQHKELVTIINDLYEAIQKNETGNILNESIPKLVRYTQEHFATEENYMIQYDYPEFQDHKQQHQTFINEVTCLVEEFQEGRKILNINLFSFLKDWLLNHIAYTDKKLGNYLNINMPAKSL